MKKPGFILAYSFCLLILVISGCAQNTPLIGTSSATHTIGAATFYTPSPGYKNLQHEVGPMETLWRIAKAYDVDINEIMRVNNLKSSAINIGQKLEIPQTKGLRPVIPLYSKRSWSYLVIHHTATETGNATKIDAIHHQRGFWDGLGYHFLIDNGTAGKLNGQIEISPRWVKQQDGAHCNAAGMNQIGIGVALVGNFSESKVSDRQLDSLVFLTSVLMKHYKIPIEHVLRHGDVPGKNTECPGNYFPWAEFMKRLRNALRK